MSHYPGSSSSSYYADGVGGNGSGNYGGRKGHSGGDYGDRRPPSRGGHSKGVSKKMAEPRLMQTYFMAEREHRIHRDVLNIRIRHHLGNRATSWYGPNENTGAWGHFYRAERAFTPAELEDLEYDSAEFERDPQGFQRRLDRTFQDHSRWNAHGGPANPKSSSSQASYPSNNPGYPGGYPPNYHASYNHGEGTYMYPSTDPYSHSSGYSQDQYQGQDPATERDRGKAKSKHPTSYPNHYDSTMSGSRSGAYGNAGPSSGMAYAGDAGGHASYPSGAAMPAGYGRDPMDTSSPYGMSNTGTGAGTGSGGYAAEQFLNNMPAPGGGSEYDQGAYGSSMTIPSSQGPCPNCLKKKCKC